MLPKQVVSFEQSPATKQAFSTGADSVENRLGRGEAVAKANIRTRIAGLGDRKLSELLDDSSEQKIKDYLKREARAAFGDAKIFQADL